ncbi:HTH-type transcriptional repressor NicS [Roseivivax sp. THAF40]|uniref:TetR/AcrR family transcriptional regulator n=1 Tax=unclassified Roseivivax TaxID=2639302 RepID=UPI001267C03D|nr:MULTISPECIES: TetR/AcrR family transcriptional regulator [unclassified Roseivivax]QFS81240.1 HTH-type transcriptional repressor NicS [Roseivivax sp. THAF197b]QFT44969.1 HTH-type transcriptional repressor NicS [Roseivivax sp. THAF40]
MADDGRQGRATWKQDPQGVQENILRVARAVFAEHGLSGARMAEIAERTETSKRMIYYYFGDKEGLYLRTLEEAYREVRAKERALDLGGLDPVEALRRLVGFTFDHHRANPDFIRLVMIENIHQGRYLERSDAIREVNRGAIATLSDIVRRGQAAGVFRPDIDPLTLHWQISAMSFFNVSNRHTFGRSFGTDLLSKEGQKALQAAVVATITAGVLSSGNGF